MQVRLSTSSATQKHIGCIGVVIRSCEQSNTVKHARNDTRSPRTILNPICLGNGECANAERARLCPVEIDGIIPTRQCPLRVTLVVGRKSAPKSPRGVCYFACDTHHVYQVYNYILLCFTTCWNNPMGKIHHI